MPREFHLDEWKEMEVDVFSKEGGKEEEEKNEKTMLVDDLIEWRNVVIASSGSSVERFTAL